MVTHNEREHLISDINALQQEMARHFAHDRGLPLLATSLTMQQLKTLIILSASDDLPGHELADKLNVKLGTVTGIVDRLVAQDLVDRAEDPQDRRVRRISLTNSGTKLIDELNDAGMSKFRRLLDELDTDMLHRFREVTRALHDAALRIHDT